MLVQGSHIISESDDVTLTIALKHTFMLHASFFFPFRSSFMGGRMSSVLSSGRVLTLLRSCFNVRKWLHSPACILCSLAGVLLFLSLNNSYIQSLQKLKRTQVTKSINSVSIYSRSAVKPKVSSDNETFTENRSGRAHHVVSRQNSYDSVTLRIRGNRITRDLQKRNGRRKKLPNTDYGIKRGLPTDLVVCVLSAPYKREARNAIRQTWARVQPTNTLVLFIIGTGLLDTAAKSLIIAENEVHRDIVVLEDFKESYIKLTQKVLETMKWMTQNIEFNYFMKVDDDTFVRLDMVLKHLASKSKERLYWGYFKHRSPISRRGKWAEPKQYICDRYVSYALGGGYIISKDLVEYIATNSQRLQMFRNEDVAIGTWLAPLEVIRTHDKRFRMFGSCYNNVIVLHPIHSVDKMKNLYNRLTVNGTLCGKTYSNIA